MLTGKAIAQAVRGHLIVDAALNAHSTALNALVLANTFDVPLPSCSRCETEEVMEATPSHENTANNPYLDEAAVLNEKLMQGSLSSLPR